jgi:anti-sigma regulatory factor (Ser/Thr protein kinase)
VLLRQQAGDGVDVLAVAGTVIRDDTPSLLEAVHGAAEPARVLTPGPALGMWLDVECGPTGPGQARRAVTECAARLGLEEVVDDLLLLVSELVTNAVRHGAPPVRLEVLADADVVRIAVGDGEPCLPLPRTADVDAEGGRGMALVDLLAQAHGVLRQPPGKTVWASVTRPGSVLP